MVVVVMDLINANVHPCISVLNTDKAGKKV